MTGHSTVGVDIRRGIIMQLDKNKPDKKDDLGRKKTRPGRKKDDLGRLFRSSF
jgi:hypothetical protein